MSIGFVYAGVLRGGVQGSALVGGGPLICELCLKINEFRIPNYEYLWKVLHLPTDLTPYVCFKRGFPSVSSSFYCFI